jgi:heat shock protein HtpX
MNGLKTALLLGLLMGLCLGVGQLLGGTYGMLIGLGVGGFGAIISYFLSAQLALAASHAQLVDRNERPDLYEMMERLAKNARIPTPKLYVSPQAAPNAFATGRGPSNGVVCVTQGLLEMMDKRELEGVIAHEMAHIKHRDILIATIAAIMAGAISFLAHMALWFGHGSRDDRRDGGNALVAILLMIFAPLAAGLIQLAISRSREYSADAEGAEIAGSPLGLISALRKLEVGNKQIPMDVSPSSAHMYISAPWIPSAEGFANLFRTHPSTERRIAELTKKLGAMNPYATA